MKEFKKGQTYFAASEDGSVTAMVWDGDVVDCHLVRQGRIFHTATEAKKRAEELFHERTEGLLHEKDLIYAASKGFRYGHVYYTVTPRVSESTMYKPFESVWYADSFDVRRLRQGLAFRTREEADAKAQELNRTDKRYPKKMLVWDSDSDPYGKLERTVIGTLAGMYITVEDFGETLRAAGNAQAITVSFYRNAEDLPETLEDYLSEIELPKGAAEKIVELAKKMKKVD